MSLSTIVKPCFDNAKGGIFGFAAGITIGVLNPEVIGLHG